jgi:hypothetical protein
MQFDVKIRWPMPPTPQRIRSDADEHFHGLFENRATLFQCGITGICGHDPSEARYSGKSRSNLKVRLPLKYRYYQTSWTFLPTTSLHPRLLPHRETTCGAIPGRVAVPLTARFIRISRATSVTSKTPELWGQSPHLHAHVPRAEDSTSR